MYENDNKFKWFCWYCLNTTERIKCDHCGKAININIKNKIDSEV